MKRKEFIRNSGRWLILCSIGVFTGYLTLNRRITGVSECEGDSLCSGCERFSTCTLQKAKRAREDGRKS